MRKLFQVWLFLTICSMAIYTPFYLFGNNALDAVEEVTPEDLIPFTGYRGQDDERIANAWRATGVDTSMELEDALDDNKLLSNVEIRYATDPQLVRASMATGLSVVEAVADVGDGLQLRIVFTVIPKRFLKSWAVVNGVLGMQITDGKHSYDMLEDLSDQVHLYALFEKSGRGGTESVQRMKGRFKTMLAVAEERERAKQRDQAGTPQPTPADPYANSDFMGVDKSASTSTTANGRNGAAISTEEYLRGYDDQFNKADDESMTNLEAYVAAKEKAAQPQAPTTQQQSHGLQSDDQAVGDGHTAGSASRPAQLTRAGNYGPDKIVIFQWEGQPAYCADEGIDGANCHGDGSAFIGAGTHEDYMDKGSSICIAGEPGCQLPQYFPADIRG
ncbi:hypothetical protein ACQCLI_32175 (plasmid) [Pseudomonas nitroreducens]|uniref:hypothetical protein n=1 Tax=Pseudomonas nitroreducens TaxID=46680 RepID=UPI000301A09D|nr:hypothetical protein [Pseudomonas nitroreducens]